MASLSGEQLAQLAYQVGFRGEQLVQMVAIATRESGGNPAAQNPKTSDSGLWQINGKANDKFLIDNHIIKQHSDLYDPVINARAAWALSQTGGGNPTTPNLKPWAYDRNAKGWSTGGNPLSGTALGPARTAVQNAYSKGLPNKPFSGTGTAKPPGGLDPRFSSALNALIAASGGRVQIGESYRSEESQKSEFLRRYAPGGSGSKNDRTYNGQKWHLKNPKDAPLASPGGSMHSIGLAADLTGDLRWVQDHAAEFGLKTFKDVDNEPWHVQLAALPNSRQEYEKSPSYVPYGSNTDQDTSGTGASPTPFNFSYAGSPPSDQGASKMIAQEERDAFNKYLKTKTPEEQKTIIDDLKKPRSLAEVGAFMAQAPPEVNRYVNFLGTLNASGQYGEKNLLAAPDPAGSAEMTNMLNRFGVSYSNAPNPTPALLAFLQGIGMNLSTAEDVKRRALERIGASTSDAMADIDRTAGRVKQNVTADLVRRGVVSSGESNTRYARHEEDVGNQRSDVQRSATQATETTEDAYAQAQQLARQQALDRILGAEQQQATDRAASAAEVDATRAQQQAADDAWQRQKAAQDASLKAQEDALRQSSNATGV